MIIYWANKQKHSWDDQLFYATIYELVWMLKSYTSEDILKAYEENGVNIGN